MDGGPRRFVILCLGRTGSNHLADLLDSHSRIRCFGEILNEKFPAAAPEGWIGDAATSDAAVHVERLFGEAPRELRAVGFKLPINSLWDHPEIKGWLAGAPDVAVIRLRRRNGLAILVSRRLVRASLVSQSTHGRYADVRVRIEPRACLRALERIEAEDAELDELASGHPTIDVDYEELASAATQERIQRSLGVTPQPLSSRFERLRKRSLAETIENWDELAAALAGTRFSGMLRE
jgi:hypothetical protein